MEATAEEAEINQKQMAEAQELNNQPPTSEHEKPEDTDDEEEKEEIEAEEEEKDENLTNVLWNKAKKTNIEKKLESANKSLEKLFTAGDFSGYKQSQLHISLQKLPLAKDTILLVVNEYFSGLQCSASGCSKPFTRLE